MAIRVTSAHSSIEASLSLVTIALAATIDESVASARTATSSIVASHVAAAQSNVEASVSEAAVRALTMTIDESIASARKKMDTITSSTVASHVSSTQSTVQASVSSGLSTLHQELAQLLERVQLPAAGGECSLDPSTAVKTGPQGLMAYWPSALVFVAFGFLAVALCYLLFVTHKQHLELQNLVSQKN